jgi:6-phosphogluconolactonase
VTARLHRFPDPLAAARACAHEILSQLRAVLGSKDFATLAISGGNSPAPMFEEMARQPVDWSRVHLFWVDERAVPASHPQSNYRLARKCLIDPARVPHANVHPVEAECAPAEAARRYEDHIRDFFGLAPGVLPRFDVIHRGIGADAHTASLFPGEPLINDRQGLAAAVWVEKLSQWRITLLPGVLLNARFTAVLASGEDKAEAVREVIAGPYDPLLRPAQLGLREGAAMSWFLDQAAAQGLE